MGLLVPLKMDVAHLKLGMYGDTGVGKTTTAALILIGLCQHYKLKGPVAFFDSERGAGFVAKLFKMAGIDIIGAQSRAAEDLWQFMIEAPKVTPLILIDSITHPWRDTMENWKKRNNRDKIPFNAWGDIKGEWHRKYVVPFVNAHAHIVMCGRKADIYKDLEEEADTRSGKTTFKPVKVGTKMSTEAETGYEPNLLIEMTKVLTNDGGSYGRLATVLKDRSFQIDGAEQTFEMPMKNKKADLDRLLAENKPFNFIKPHIEMLANEDGGGIKGESKADLFPGGDSNYYKDQKEKELVLGDIKQLMTDHWAGRTKEELKAKNDVIEAISMFLGKKTRNWQRIEEQYKLEDVKKFYFVLQHLMDKCEDAVRAAVSRETARESVEELHQVIMGMGEPSDEPEDDLPFD